MNDKEKIKRILDTMFENSCHKNMNANKCRDVRKMINDL